MSLRRTTLSISALAIASGVFISATAVSGGKPQTLHKQASTAVIPATHDRFIVSYKPGTKRTAAAQRASFDTAAKALGLSSVTSMRTLGTGAALIRTSGKLDAAAGKRLAMALLRDPSVVAVEPDRKMRPLLVPNDPQYPAQWHYMNGPGGINVAPAWDTSNGSGIVVAVIDTGITQHPDLAGQTVPGYDFISADEDGGFATAADGDGRDADPSDPGDFDAEGVCNVFGAPSDSTWHGTHVAGTIAAATNNAVGVAGVAYGAKIEPLRALGLCGGYLSDIVDAVTWASGGTVAGTPANANPAEVINLSLGGDGECGVAEADAYRAAVARGSTVVVAAGNSSADTAGSTPANCPGVLAVSAVGPTGRLAAYSNFGSIVSVAAPGGAGEENPDDDVLSTINLGKTTPGAPGYTAYAGTSMAAPHVAGIVALMQAAAPTPLTPERVKKILENTAFAANGRPPNCNAETPCGAGIVDAPSAVAVAAGTQPLPADPPPPPPPPPPLPLSNGVTVTGISLAAGDNVVYAIDVPAGATDLSFTLAGGPEGGDGDLYVRFGDRPNGLTYDCRPFTDTSNESCPFPTPQAGTYFVRIVGFSATTNLTLTASFSTGQTDGQPTNLQVRKQRSKTAVSWTGGTPRVDVYKNGAMWKTIGNGGVLYDSLRTAGNTQPRYKICNTGTQSCSAEVTRAN